MNPTTTITTAADPLQPPPPPPQLQPPRSSFSCDRHPDEQFTGFCPSCLCERLTTLDQSSNSNNASSSRRNSTSSSSAAAALKSLFSTVNKAPPPPPAASHLPPKNPSKPTSFFPELRRTKSFSASKNEALGLSFEPQRKSCDVRGRNTLWSLFSLDDETRPSCSRNPSNTTANDNNHTVVSLENPPVLESKEEEEEEPESENDRYYELNDDINDAIVEENDEITEIQEPRLDKSSSILEKEPNLEIVEEEEVSVNANLNLNENDVIMKSMKDHIDLDSQAKKGGGARDLKEIAKGSFWSAASVFSKKWHKWRRKQKEKKENNVGGRKMGGVGTLLPVEKSISRQYRETQSEIADYGFGRRSCDTDPRFSLDAGRISFDDPRYSFDEPRASWDGYLIGRSFPRMPPMLAVVEDAPVVSVPRSDANILVEEPPLVTNCINEDENVPGGSVQTREYYSDSSSRRRKSLDRSSSIRKTAAAVVAEIDEMKAASNAKVSPATAEYFHGAKVLVGERDLRDSNSNSLRDDCSETFELSGFRDNASVIGNGERKGSKKSRRWSWNIWGLIHRRGGGGNKDEDEERYSRVNGVERSYSESWQDLRRDGNVEGRVVGLNRKVLRSNSSVSWRHSNGMSFGSTRKSGIEMNGHGKKKKDEFVLERNRSARYSPNHTDNGLLRFYLTPMRSSRRGGLGKSRPNNSQSIARSVLRLY